MQHSTSCVSECCAWLHSVCGCHNYIATSPTDLYIWFDCACLLLQARLHINSRVYPLNHLWARKLSDIMQAHSHRLTFTPPGLPASTSCTESMKAQKMHPLNPIPHIYCCCQAVRHSCRWIHAGQGLVTLYCAEDRGRSYTRTSILHSPKQVLSSVTSHSLNKQVEPSP